MGNSVTAVGRGLGWALLSCVLATSGCSGGDDDGGSGGSGGSGAGGSGGSGGSGASTFSCNDTANFACFELQVPPGGVQAATDQCTADGATPGTACPTAGVIGECQGSPHFYYYPGFSDIDQAQQVCTGLGGTWVAH
jgi:hypothetical protein